MQWGTLFIRYPYMICPVQDLSTSVFSDVTCQPNNVFVWRELALPQSVTTLLEPIVRILVPLFWYRSAVLSAWLTESSSAPTSLLPTLPQSLHLPSMLVSAPDSSAGR